MAGSVRYGFGSVGSASRGEGSVQMNVGPPSMSFKP